MLRIVANHLKLNALLLFTVFVVSNVAYLFIAYKLASWPLPVQ